MNRKILTLMASALVLAAGAQAQISAGNPPTNPNPPSTPPVASLLQTVTIVATDPTALEGTSSGSFTLISDSASTNDLTVNLIISGTASNGVDYTTLADTVIIPAGCLAVDLPIDPIVDTITRGNKTVVLGIQTNAAYLIGSARPATVQIIDDIYNIVPPTVSLISPTNGSVFNHPAVIVLTADASDLDVPIRSVSFYADNQCVGSVSNSPYSLTWTNAEIGRCTVFARVVDQVGQSTLSAPVNITITNEVPVIQLTSPTNGQNFVAGGNILFTANLSPDAFITQFFANGHVVGTLTNATSPATFTWNHVPAGVYRLQGEAINAAGTRGYSGIVMINVSRH